MRILYFTLVMLFTVTLFAQTPLDFQNGTTEGISEVKLYPNPAFGGIIHILTSANANKRVTIYDVFGKMVLTDKIIGKTLDISRLIPGIYVLQINEDQKTMTRKLVVK